MRVPVFGVEASRRLMFGMLGASTALLFATYGLIGAGVSAPNLAYAARVSEAVSPLMYCAVSAVISIVLVELADHPSTPKEGHPHSVRNNLETVSTVGFVICLTTLAWGAVTLAAAAIVRVPV